MIAGAGKQGLGRNVRRSRLDPTLFVRQAYSRTSAKLSRINAEPSLSALPAHRPVSQGHLGHRFGRLLPLQILRNGVVSRPGCSEQAAEVRNAATRRTQQNVAPSTVTKTLAIGFETRHPSHTTHRLLLFDPPSPICFHGRRGHSSRSILLMRSM